MKESLESAGETVHLHRDHFKPDARDWEWLPVVGAKRWVILTKDNQIHRRQIELTALKNANARSFVLVSAGLTGAVQADIIVRALPRIHEEIEAGSPPFIARIYRDSSVVRIKLR